MSFLFGLTALIIALFGMIDTINRSGEQKHADLILVDSGLPFTRPPVTISYRSIASGPFFSDLDVNAVFLLSPEDRLAFANCDMPGFGMKSTRDLDDYQSKINSTVICMKFQKPKENNWFSYELYDGFLVYRYILF